MLDELPRPRGIAKSYGGFSPQLAKYIRIGMDSRVQAFSYMESGTIPGRSGIFPMQMAIYANVDLGQSYDVYLNRYMLQGNTEFWVRLRSDDGTKYLRVGRFLPAFGLRLDDHTSFIRGGNVGRTVLGGLAREGNPFSPYAHGGGEIEGGIYLGDMHLSMSVSNPFITEGSAVGSWFNRMTVVSRAELFKYVGALDVNTLLGISYLEESPIIIRGIFGGLSRNKLSILGELDYTRHWAGAGVTSRAQYVELSIKMVAGFHVSLKYDHFDQDITLADDTLTRITLGGEWFPRPFMEVKPQLRFNGNSIGKPEQLQFLLQLHMFI